MGHIELSRAADLVVVAPATADLIAKLANGLANDLASTLLLATDKRVLLAPAMNVRMWEHPATRRNLATVTADGALVVGPNEGEMACGEFGPGRMAEPPEIVAAIDAALAPGTARRPPRARHLRPHPRADRPGALHRQPLLRPPGQRHRRGARPPRRPRHLRHRPRRGAPPGGRHRRRGRDRGARCSPPSRRRSPPTPPSSPPPSPTGASPRRSGSKVKKDPSGQPAGARARREPRHPAHHRRPRRPPAPRRRLRRRDRRPRRQRHRQAPAQGRRLDRRQRRLARRPASWAAPRTRSR